jgi:hypothetical protein
MACERMRRGSLSHFACSNFQMLFLGLQLLQRETAGIRRDFLRTAVDRTALIQSAIGTYIVGEYGHDGAAGCGHIRVCRPDP